MKTPTKEQICKNCKYFFHTPSGSGACNALPKREWTEKNRIACSLFKIREDK